MLGNFGFSEAIALIAVIVAFYYQQQASKLNKLLLAKEAAEASDKKRADLGARIVRVKPSNYVLKIFNRGKATARNVMIEQLPGTDLLDPRDIEEKLPHEALEPQQGIEFIAVIYWGSRGKHPLKLTWDDEFKIGNEKIVYPTS